MIPQHRKAFTLATSGFQRKKAFANLLFPASIAWLAIRSVGQSIYFKIGML